MKGYILLKTTSLSFLFVAIFKSWKRRERMRKSGKGTSWEWRERKRLPEKKEVELDRER